MLFRKLESSERIEMRSYVDVQAGRKAGLQPGDQISGIQCEQALKIDPLTGSKSDPPRSG